LPWFIQSRARSVAARSSSDRACWLQAVLGDKPILFLDHGARGSIAIDATKDFAWNSAIGPLRAVCMEYIEEHEFCSRCGFSCHSQNP